MKNIAFVNFDQTKPAEVVEDDLEADEAEETEEDAAKA
jgi:hypothetical protein